MFRRLTNLVNHASLRAYVALQTFAAFEPVRLRAALTSAVIGLAVLFPAIDAGTAQTVGAIGVIALPLLVGESTRTRVTPAK